MAIVQLAYMMFNIHDARDIHVYMFKHHGCQIHLRIDHMGCTEFKRIILVTNLGLTYKINRPTKNNVTKQDEGNYRPSKQN